MIPATGRLFRIVFCSNIKGHMSDTAQLIKDKLDIVDFLKEYLKLSPAGKNYKALCPFHKEKTPSFMISPDRGVWHCFGCAAGGDIIKFLMLFENLEFYDALKILAEKAGIEMRTISNRDFHAHNNLYKVTEAAKDFFKKELIAAPAARQYLLDRGLKEETIQEFELGLAPASSDILMRHLIGLGFNVLDLEKAGLVSKNNRGVYWDWFRSRVMFPIHNHLGKVIGFTGRVLPGQENANVGKYVNSPETPIFQKSKILYGLYRAKNDIRQSGTAVLVEGQMDCLMAWQDGIKNVVATSGTALTQDHLAVLRRISDSLVIGFDSDEGGKAATERAIDLAGAMDFNTKVMLISGYKDPAELVQKEPGRLGDLVSGALPAMQYYFYKYINSLKDVQIFEKKKGIRAVLSKIAILGSAVERSCWLKELSGLTGIEEPVLTEEMAQVKISGFTSSERVDQEAVKESVSRKDLICQRIIALSLNRKEFHDSVASHQEYFSPLYQNVSAKLLNSSQALQENAEVDNLISLINLRSGFDSQNSDETKIAAEFQELLRQLKKLNFKERSQKLVEHIKNAEMNGDDDKMREYQKEHQSIHQEIQKL